MEKFLNNKFFIIFLLTIVLVFTTFSSCFATDYSSFIDTNDTGYLSYDYSSYISEKNYLIYKNNNSSDSYFLLTCDGTIYYNSPYICCNNDCNLYKLESGSISNLGSFSSGSVVGLSSIKLLTSNTNIYDNSAEPELVFQVAQVGEEVAFLPESQVEELLPKVNQMTSIILVPCLSVFGVLLVVFLIKSKNLLHL